MNAHEVIDRFVLDAPGSTGAGRDYALIEEDLREVATHFGEPVSRRPLVQQFQDLVATWRKETAFVSSVDRMVLNSAYLQIIGLGPDVIPLLLRELQREPNHWFCALHALTAADPVPEKDRGDIRRMCEAWIHWGRRVKYFYD